MVFFNINIYAVTEHEHTVLHNRQTTILSSYNIKVYVEKKQHRLVILFAIVR